MDLDQRYPGLTDLRQRAQMRLPKFVWEYLDSGTGAETVQGRNRAALDRIGFAPRVLGGPQSVDLATSFLGQTSDLPFGIAPVGMSGLIWGDAEGHLARAAAKRGLPYCLSTVAAQSPEDLAPYLGPNAWFQLYPPKDEEIRRHMLERARRAGFKVLVLTVDVPVASRRERLQRSGLSQPPRLSPRLALQVLHRPAWTAGMLWQHRREGGLPHMRMLDPYVTDSGAKSSTAHVGYLLRTAPDWSYLRWLRGHWEGPLVVKGVLNAEDAPRLKSEGVDAIWVSNHAGRQFDGAPSSVDALTGLRAATDLPLIFDSGIEGGLDILRAFAVGADFCMLGRGFHYALAALGAKGPGHLIDILERDLVANMGQLGVTHIKDMRDLVPRAL